MENIQHPLYTYQPDLHKAHALAWVFTNSNSSLQKFPFLFPQIDPFQVRIKILYTALCQSDLLTVREKWGGCQYPACPGHQIIGQITLIGQKVNKRQIGDIVGVCPQRDCCMQCENCLKGKTNLCIMYVGLYGYFFGGYATHIQVKQNFTFIIPKNLDIAVSAPLLCAGVTVYAPIKRYHKPGMKCAILGIGGLGHLAIMYASKMGMEVTVFTTSFNREKQFKEMGASHLQHSTKMESLQKCGGKFDLVLNTLFVQDEELYKAYIRLTKIKGTYVILGVPNNKTLFPLDHQFIIKNQIRIAGSLIGSIEQVQDMLQYSANYSIRPIVQKFDFEELPKAFQQLQKGRPKFRCVVSVAQWAQKNGFNK